MARIRSVATERLQDLLDLHAFDAILRRVDELASKRNAIEHGVWNETPAIHGGHGVYFPPDERSLNMAVKKQGTEVASTVWTNDLLEALAASIARARFDLNALMHPLPAPIGRDYTGYFDRLRRGEG